MTGKELSTVQDRIAWSQALAGSAMLPAQYRGHPENLFYAAEYADALGIPRIAVLTSIYVIDGKPAAQADLIQSLVRMAGHRLRVVVAPDGQSVTASLIRGDDPDFEFTSTWTLDRAATAGLAGGSNWRKYPVAMMSARAITEVARQGAAEALLGIRYTPEELGATVVDEEGTPEKSEPLAAQAAIEGITLQADMHWTEDIAGAETIEALREVWRIAQHQGVLADRIGDLTVRDMLKARADELEGSPGDVEDQPKAADDQLATIGEWGDTFEWNARAMMAHVRKVIGEHVNDLLDLTETEAARVIVTLAALSEQPAADAGETEPLIP